MFGTGTALIPWAVVRLFTGEYGYALSLVILYVLTQGIRQVIQPKIVGDSMDFRRLQHYSSSILVSSSAVLRE